MFIQTETTANPERMRFLPGQTLLSAGTAGFLDKESSARSPLAQRLFEIAGITSVYLDPQAITLTKTDDVEWPMLRPVIGLRQGDGRTRSSANRPLLTELA